MLNDFFYVIKHWLQKCPLNCFYKEYFCNSHLTNFLLPCGKSQFFTVLATNSGSRRWTDKIFDARKKIQEFRKTQSFLYFFSADLDFIVRENFLDYHSNQWNVNFIHTEMSSVFVIWKHRPMIREWNWKLEHSKIYLSF